jgi:hypothetical protein
MPQRTLLRPQIERGQADAERLFQVPVPMDLAGQAEQLEA